MRLRREDHRQEPDADEAIFLSDRVVVRASRPGRIKTDLVVDLERPRSGEVDTTPRFGEIERRVLADIREETLEMMAPSGLSRHRADCEVPLPESPERTAAAFVTHAMDAGRRHPPLPLVGRGRGWGSCRTISPPMQRRSRSRRLGPGSRCITTPIRPLRGHLPREGEGRTSPMARLRYEPIAMR